MFYKFFDSFCVRDNLPTVIHIGRNAIGSIEFYPSEINPFIAGHGHVRVYDINKPCLYEACDCGENHQHLVSSDPVYTFHPFFLKEFQGCVCI